MYRVWVRAAQACDDGMKRRLLIIAICLLLGAVVNVAVAWGCGEWSYRTLADSRSSGLPSDARWPRDWPQPTSRATVSGVGMTLAALSGRNLRGPYAHQWICQWGWPFRSLESEAHSWAQDTGGSTTGITWGWPRSWPPKPIAPANGFLLMCPLWPGFALNTIFYAALLWLLICGPLAMRRFIRVRRGLCPACAYPRGESDVCSECGKALPSRHIIV